MEENKNSDKHGTHKRSEHHLCLLKKPTGDSLQWTVCKPHTNYTNIVFANWFTNKMFTSVYADLDDIAMMRILFPMNFNSWFVLGSKKRVTALTSQGTTTCNNSSFSILRSVHFCEEIATQFLQCSQKLKNYISLQFHIEQFTKCGEKKCKLTFETTLVQVWTEWGGGGLYLAARIPKVFDW